MHNTFRPIRVHAGKPPVPSSNASASPQPNTTIVKPIPIYTNKTTLQKPILPKPIPLISFDEPILPDCTHPYTENLFRPHQTVPMHQLPPQKYDIDSAVHSQSRWKRMNVQGLNSLRKDFKPKQRKSSTGDPTHEKPTVHFKHQFSDAFEVSSQVGQFKHYNPPSTTHPDSSEQKPRFAKILSKKSSTGLSQHANNLSMSQDSGFENPPPNILNNPTAHSLRDPLLQESNDDTNFGSAPLLSYISSQDKEKRNPRESLASKTSHCQRNLNVENIDALNTNNQSKTFSIENHIPEPSPYGTPWPISSKDSSLDTISSQKVEKVPSTSDHSGKTHERKFGYKKDTPDNDNPWFQKRKGVSGDEEFNDLNLDEEIQDELNMKSRRKKLGGKLGRIFRAHGKPYDPDNITESSNSSLDSFPLTESVSDGSSSQIQEENSGAESSVEDRLEDIIRLAITGKKSLTNLLDCLLLLTKRPGEGLLELLFKYLSSNSIIEASVKLILDDDRETRISIQLANPYGTYSQQTLYRDLLVNIYLTAPHHLKRSLLQHSKARGDIFRFLGREKPKDKTSSDKWILKACALCRVLYALLEDSPTELTDYLCSRKGLLRSIVTKHIHIPEVVGCVAKLCAADALSDISGDDLRYGAPNATGIILLVKEGICDLLVDLFVKSCGSHGKENDNSLCWQIQIMSLRCLQELSKRAVVIPKFGKGNCSYSSKYIKSLNCGLESLSLFDATHRVKGVLDAAFDSLSELPGISSCGTKAERNNPLVCCLRLVTDHLELVRNASEAKLAVTRRTVGSIKTKKLEKVLLSENIQFLNYLDETHKKKVGGRVRLGIINVFRCLFSSKTEEVWLLLSKNLVPEKLLEVLKHNDHCSMLCAGILKCMYVSMKQESAKELYKAWGRALSQDGDWKGAMLNLLEGEIPHVTDGRVSEASLNNYINIGLILVEAPEHDEKLKLVFPNIQVYQTFVKRIQPKLMRIQECNERPFGGPKPEGNVFSVLANAESLVARLDDVNAV